MLLGDVVRVALAVHGVEDSLYTTGMGRMPAGPGGREQSDGAIQTL